MYNYKIAYSNYDEYSCFELTHHKKFTKQELHSIVQHAMKNVCEKMDDDKIYGLDRIAFLFFNYKLICELHNFGFENLEYETAIEFEDVKLSNYNYPLCGPASFGEAKTDKCDTCEIDECGIGKKDLKILCTEYGVIAENGD